MVDSPMGKVVTKVKRCQEKLKWWSKRCFGNITHEIAKKKKQLRKAEEVAFWESSVEQMVKLKEELAELILKEEKLW